MTIRELLINQLRAVTECEDYAFTPAIIRTMAPGNPDYEQDLNDLIICLYDSWCDNRKAIEDILPDEMIWLLIWEATKNRSALLTLNAAAGALVYKCDIK